MLNEANRQTHNSTVACHSEHVCCVSDGPVRIIFVVVVDAVQAIAMIEPMPPLPIDMLQNVCVNVIIAPCCRMRCELSGRRSPANW